MAAALHLRYLRGARAHQEIGKDDEARQDFKLAFEAVCALDHEEMEFIGESVDCISKMEQRLAEAVHTIVQRLFALSYDSFCGSLCSWG